MLTSISQNGLTLEEAIEREQSRIPAKDRFDRIDADGNFIPASRRMRAIDPDLAKGEQA